MKTLKIDEKTHKDLLKIKVYMGYKSLDQTINWLLRVYNHDWTKGEFKFDDK